MLPVLYEFRTKYFGVSCNKISWYWLGILWKHVRLVGGTLSLECEGPATVPLTTKFQETHHFNSGQDTGLFLISPGWGVLHFQVFCLFLAQCSHGPQDREATLYQDFFPMYRRASIYSNLTLDITKSEKFLQSQFSSAWVSSNQFYAIIWLLWGFFCFFCLFVFFCLFTFPSAAPAAYGGSQYGGSQCGGSQARGRIRAVATGWCQSHSNTGSKPRLRPTPQLTATPDP